MVIHCLPSLTHELDGCAFSLGNFDSFLFNFVPVSPSCQDIICNHSFDMKQAILTFFLSFFQKDLIVFLDDKPFLSLISPVPLTDVRHEILFLAVFTFGSLKLHYSKRLMFSNIHFSH